MDDIAQRVKKVVSRQLKVPVDKIREESDFVKDLGAESIQSIELVAAFEEEFGITMDEDAALSIKTVGKAIEFIERHLKEKQ